MPSEPALWWEEYIPELEGEMLEASGKAARWRQQSLAQGRHESAYVVDMEEVCLRIVSP